MQSRILTSRLAQRAAVALGATALPALSFAQGLPQLENPTRGAGNGIMETIRNYGYDIIMLVALLVVASMFIGVCYHAYGTYAEIHTGRKTWGQFGLTVAIGAVLLVWGVWAIRTAYVGRSESRLNQRQFLGVCIRFVAMYLVLSFFLLS